LQATDRTRRIGIRNPPASGSGNRLEQNRASSIVKGDFLTVGGALYQLAQIPAGLLHGHCFQKSVKP
jgi:hypothetical protein